MNLDALIEAERNAPAEATPREQRKVWSSIERSVLAAPLLGPTAVSAAAQSAGKASGFGKLAAALSTTTGKVVLATTLVAGGTATALQVPAPPPRAAKTAEADAPAPTTANKPRTQRATNTKPPRLRPTPQPVRDASVVPVQRPKAKREPVSPSRPTATKSEAPPSPEPKAPELLMPDGKLLITRAEDALRKRKYDAALHLLRRHRKLYPDSPLVERREAIFVLALCRAGRSLAPKARWEFNRNWPKSAFRKQLGDACKR